MDEAKWRRVAERLRGDITAGRLAAGALLPPERDLAAALGVSRPTVRSALDRLARDGLLSREQGRGTFVRLPRPSPGPLVHVVYVAPHPEEGGEDPFMAGLVAALAAVPPGRLGSVRVVPMGIDGEFLAALAAYGYPQTCRGGIAVIGLRMPDDRDLERLERDGVPVVLLGAPIGLRPVAAIRTDPSRTGRQAAEHLLAHGHRRIALLDGPWEHWPCRERRDGFLAALAAAGVRAQVAEGAGWDGVRSLHAARALLTAPEGRPTALAVYGDRGAAAVFTAAAELGLRIPDDLALVGFDLAEAAARGQPVPLAALVPDVAAWASALMDALAGGPPAVQVVVDRWLAGTSCGCLPQRPTSRDGAVPQWRW